MSQLSERSLRRGADPDVAGHIDEVVTLWNAGRYQIRTLSGAPTHTGNEGEMFGVNFGGSQYIYVWIGGAWRSVLLS